MFNTCHGVQTGLEQETVIAVEEVVSHEPPHLQSSGQRGRVGGGKGLVENVQNDQLADNFIL